MGIQGQRMVITGAASGMGAATARLAASKGARVFLSDVNVAGGNTVANEIRAAGGEAWFMRCDMSSREDIEAMIEAAAGAMGGIDVLHNNAGIIDSQIGDADAIRVEAFDLDVWSKVLAVNLTGPLIASRAAVPYLKVSSNPSIINAGSLGSFTASAGTTAYSVSKHGIAGLTRSLALDLAPYGIRANCYCPGVIETGMLTDFLATQANAEAIIRDISGAHLVPGLGKPTDIAEFVCFLAGTESRFINGAILMIDGGALAWRGTTALQAH